MPVYVGALGLVSARAGHADRATSLLGELEDRAHRAEYIEPFARLAIHVGLGNIAGIRRELAACIVDGTAYWNIKVYMGSFLEADSIDAEIARLNSVLRDGMR
jgi:hypothetical protein